MRITSLVRPFTAAAFLLLASLPAPAAAADGVDFKSVEQTVERLDAVLKGTGFVARLYCRAPCDVGPAAASLPAAASGSGVSAADRVLASVRALFTGRRDVSITNDAPGIIRINIGRTPTDLLQTVIGPRRLSEYERYVVFIAFAPLWRDPAFWTAERRLGLQTVPVICGCIFKIPEPRDPHLPELLSPITADRFLDLFATTFHKTVYYVVYPESHQYLLSFGRLI